MPEKKKKTPEKGTPGVSDPLIGQRKKFQILREKHKDDPKNYNGLTWPDGRIVVERWEFETGLRLLLVDNWPESVDPSGPSEKSLVPYPGRDKYGRLLPARNWKQQRFLDYWRHF